MEELNNFFKMLSDETRLRILIVLYHQELVVCEICGVLGLSQPKVSKHLTKLRDMGYVKYSRREQYISYKLNLEDPVLKNILKEIVNNIDKYPQALEDIKKIDERDVFYSRCKQTKNILNQKTGK